MAATAEKLDHIQKLIDSGFTQDASVLIKGCLQEDSSDYDAWELLAQVTSGSARELCLEKARYLRQNGPKVDDDKTIPFVVEPRSRAKPK
ncbi:MAG: hypothetical protein AAGD96_25185, partial [Chloroflexota bacterium]